MRHLSCTPWLNDNSGMGVIAVGRQQTNAINQSSAAIKLLEYVRGRRCRCGRHKAAGQSFCCRCLTQLSVALQEALAAGRLDHGYEESYGEALQSLGKGRVRE